MYNRVANRTTPPSPTSWEGQVGLVYLSESGLVYLFATGSERPAGDTKKGEQSALPWMKKNLDLLGHNLMDGLGALHSDQLLIESAVKIAEVVRIKAHPVKHGGMHVPHVQTIPHRSGT